MRKILAVMMIFTVVSFYMFTPKYPVPSEKLSLEGIHQFINRTMRTEADNFRFQYVDEGGMPVEILQSVKKMTDKLKQCGEDKQCLINAYKEHQDKWTSDELRRSTRERYMVDKFGVLGEQINQSDLYRFY